MSCFTTPTKLIDFTVNDESAIQKEFSALVRPIRMELEPANTPKNDPYKDKVEDPVVENVEGRTMLTRMVSKDRVAINGIGTRPLSSSLLDIHKFKAFPKPRGVLQAVIESLLHKKARSDEAAILERNDTSNVAKCLPVTRSKEPVVGDVKMTPDFKTILL